MGARIRVCGRLELELDGERVEGRLPGRQGPLVVGVLVLGRGRPVSRDELIGVLWPDRAPADPDEALSAVLSKVRQALGSGVLAGRRELSLSLPADTEVDWERAFAGLDRAQAALDEGEPERAWEAGQAVLEAAGRGFLVGLDSPWVEDRRRELEELRLAALEVVAGAGVRLGGSRLVGAERAAREVVAVAPLREAGHRLLMEALAARGEPAQALAAYEQLRVTLRDELGTTPGAAVRALHERLLAGAEPATPGALPALLARERGELVGRGRELERLEGAWAEARAGRPGLVFLAGGPGIGKTRLAAELARVAQEQGTVLYGACQEEALVSYEPFVEALRHYASGRTEGAPGGLGPGRAELARLIPELAVELGPDGEPPPDDPETRRYLMFEAIAALLGEASSRAPVLLVLDDLHWADRSTVQLLRHLSRPQYDTALLILASYRDAEISPEHPLFELLADLRRHRLFERLTLVGLDQPGVEALIESQAGEAASSELVQALHARTAGNPFFVEEMVRHLIESGLLFERGGRAPRLEDIGVPEGVKEVLGRRLARLSQRCHTVLSHAAVLGYEFRFDLLPPMAELDEEAVIGALEEALGARLVFEEEDGSLFAFTHALVRETLYGELSAPRRQRIHARAALAIEDAPGIGDAARSGSLALHWWEARKAPEALTSSLAAATAAEDLFAFAEALRHRRHALEIWDRVPDAEARAGRDLAQLLARAAENANLIADSARAIELARRAIELVDPASEPVRAALLRERLGRYLWLDGHAEDALGAHREGVELMVGKDPSAELARVLAGHAQILMLRGRTRESRERCEQAIEVARSAGARAEEGHALNTLGVDMAALGDRCRGIEHLREAKEIAVELGWVEEVARAYVNLTATIERDGRLRESVDVTLEGMEAMRRLGAPLGAVFLGNDAARRLMRLGRLEEAAQTLEGVREARPYGISEAGNYTGEAELACIRGELDAAREAARLARDAFRGSRDSMYYGPAAATEIGIQLAAARPSEAVAAFEQALELITGRPDAFSVACLYARGVRAYADLGAERAALAAVERFDALLAAERFPEGDPPPLVLAYRATIEAELARLRGSPDPRLWREAAERWALGEEPLERAYAEWRLAEALLLAGDGKAEARELLARVAAEAREIGAATLLGEVEASAQRRPPARAPSP